MKTSVGYLIRFSAILALLVCAQSLHAQTYNAVTGFSPTSNPNGVWTYDYNGGAYSGSQTVSNFLGTGLSGWWTGESVPNSLIILQNNTGSTVNYSTVYDPTNTLWMDPETGNVAVVFTAPAAGTYSITGNFLGIDVDENSPLVEVLDNGTVVWSGTLSSYNQNDLFNLSETLAAGGTITFEVETGTSGSCTYCFLGTALDATISDTPEPSTFILFGSGLLGLIPLLRRKRFS
jgi:hypothetical protein